jgi:F-type H+-transporting ATPase subunit b
MEGGLGSLGVDWPTLIAQLTNVIILFVLLYLVAYKPLMRMFDERSRKIKESMEQTEYIKEQAVKAEEEVSKRIAEASKEGQNIIDQAIKAGEEARQQKYLEAEKEAEKLIARSQVEIHRERDEAIGELRKEFADLTILAAEKVIDRSLDKKAHRQLIEKALEDSSVLKED